MSTARILHSRSDSSSGLIAVREIAFDQLGFRKKKNLLKFILLMGKKTNNKFKPRCYAVLTAAQDVYQPRRHDVTFNVIMHPWYQLMSSQWLAMLNGLEIVSFNRCSCLQ